MTLTEITGEEVFDYFGMSIEKLNEHKLKLRLEISDKALIGSFFDPTKQVEHIKMIDKIILNKELIN